MRDDVEDSTPAGSTFGEKLTPNEVVDAEEGAAACPQPELQQRTNPPGNRRRSSCRIYRQTSRGHECYMYRARVHALTPRARERAAMFFAAASLTRFRNDNHAPLWYAS